MPSAAAGMLLNDHSHKKKERNSRVRMKNIAVNDLITDFVIFFIVE